MSLNTEEGENTEQNEMKELRTHLEQTNQVVKHLSVQLSELRDKVITHIMSLMEKTTTLHTHLSNPLGQSCVWISENFK